MLVATKRIATADYVLWEPCAAGATEELLIEALKPKGQACPSDRFFPFWSRPTSRLRDTQSYRCLTIMDQYGTWPKGKYRVYDLGPSEARPNEPASEERSRRRQSRQGQPAMIGDTIGL